MSDGTFLTWGSRITVGQLKTWIAGAERPAIADFLLDRFSERYFRPLSGKSTSGFLLMGVSCLVIEALESYRQGWQSSERLGEKPFLDFFRRPGTLNEFSTVAGAFYKHIRCGILHQGETTGGWTITQEPNEPLLDQPNTKVNAAKFQVALEQVLKDYVRDLKAAAITADIWTSCLYKLQATIRNCD